MKSASLAFWIFFCCFGLLPPESQGQSIYHEFWGTEEDSRFGDAVAGAGDVNGDGFADLLIGAPQQYFGADQNLGAAWVFSGQDGDLLYLFSGNARGEEFGYRVAGAGDVNGDGYDDIMASGLMDQFYDQSGRVAVYSGADGSVLHDLSGRPTGPFPLPWMLEDHLGSSIGGLGDVDGDGFADFFVGASHEWQGPHRFARAGSITAYSGGSGDTLNKIFGARRNTYLGMRTGHADVNHDGIPDFIEGQPFYDAVGAYSGRVGVVSGKNGRILFQLFGDADSDYFGYSVCGVEDLNRDGHDDFLVGAPGGAPGGSSSPGYVRVFSGRDGAELITIPGEAAGDRFGCTVASFGDLNADDIPEFLVGACRTEYGGEYSGSVYVISGRNGSVMFRFDGRVPREFFGSAIACAGDVNGDGWPDLLGGTVYAESQGIRLGAARVIVFPNFVLKSPDPGSAGQDNTLTVTHAAPGSRIRLLFALRSGSTSIPGCVGMNLDLAQPVHSMGIQEADQDERAAFLRFIPAQASGKEVFFQALAHENCTVSNLVAFRFP